MTEKFKIATNGIHLEVEAAGHPEGPLLLLLHGFPESSLAWRKQTAHFAALGYRVLVPNQRGYCHSDKPASIRAYAIDELARDALGLIDWAGKLKAQVVGHDWGGAVAWHLASRYPDRVSRLVILNVPHPAAMSRALRTDFRQLLRSLYIFFFQIPLLPEGLLSLGRARLLERSMKRSSRAGTFEPEILSRYREGWLLPGALRSMIHWYRAIRYSLRSSNLTGRVSVPVLILWGARDAFLGRGMAQDSLAYCADARLEFFEDATHWIHHEEPAAVNARIQEFLAEGTRDTAQALE